LKIGLLDFFSLDEIPDIDVLTVATSDRTACPLDIDHVNIKADHVTNEAYKVVREEKRS